MIEPISVWDDEAGDWSGYDLVLPRSTWDYAERRDDFLAWAASVPRVLNPLEMLEWNTDKQRYLTDLAAAGVPVVPTTFVGPGDELRPPDDAFVVKPAISAGGRSSARFDAQEAPAARALVARIHAENRTAMIQPYLGEHDERALVYLDGEYSHAVRRRVPLPAAGDRDVLYFAYPQTGQALQVDVELSGCGFVQSPSSLRSSTPDLLARLGALLDGHP